MIVILNSCRREIADFPEGVREDLADALARLDEGLTLSMPLSRPMPSISKGVHELRLRDRAGIYRVIYLIKPQEKIFVIHGFKKTTKQTPPHVVNLVRRKIHLLDL